MVGFGGWDMPVYYEGINEEHRAVRTAVGLFDVSHMGQVFLEGSGALGFLGRLLSNDPSRLAVGEAQYTLLTNGAGGIVDDLIVYRLDDQRYLLVVNAANIANDVAFLEAARSAGDPVLDNASERWAMVALQGPDADRTLASRVDDPAALAVLPSFSVGRFRVSGADVLVARTGYTGEAGFEIMCASGDIGAVWDDLIGAGVTPCGLGARDTLRLEVCYPLHGNDIGPETDPISAGLGRFCVLDREFTGSDAIRRVKADGPVSRLVAFAMTERAIPRSGLDVVVDGAVVGHVTSGTMSPSLGEGIGLAYVEVAHAGVDTPVSIDIRGRLKPAIVKRKPLYTKEPRA